MSKVNVTITHEQAVAASAALGLYVRVCLGKIEEIGHMVRDGDVSLRADAGADRVVADLAVCERMDALCQAMKRALGFPANGSYSIGNSKVIDAARDANEVKKLIDQGIVERSGQDKTFSVTLEQASALSASLDFYTRICIGQLDEVAGLVRQGVIPVFSETSGDRVMASIEVSEDVEMLVNEAKRLLGHPSNGSFGVGNRHVIDAGHRAYEIKKVLDKAIAEHRNPNPDFRTVNYDGLVVRYTNDPAPVAVVVE